jgi:DHA2 family methylenomycin A resistance protein-like MFS transporter
VRARIDLVGGLVLSLALLAGVGALTGAGARGWTDPLIVGGLALAGVALAGFVMLELRLRAPLIDPRLFASRPFAAANSLSLLTGYGLATAIIGGPVFVDRVMSGGQSDAALALTALTAAIAVGAIVGGGLAAVVGERIVTLGGVLLSALGLWLAIGWETTTLLDRLVRDLAVYGAGFGLTVAPRATAAVESAGRGAYGVASAMLQITRTVGMSIGLALLTSIGQNRIDELSALINDRVQRDALVVELGRPEFVGVDPNASLALVAVLEEWSRGQAADVLQLVLAIALGVTLTALVPAWFVRGTSSG